MRFSTVLSFMIPLAIGAMAAPAAVPDAKAQFPNPFKPIDDAIENFQFGSVEERQNEIQRIRNNQRVGGGDSFSDSLREVELSDSLAD